MKFLFTAILFFCSSSLLFSQNINIESPADQNSYSTNTFSANGGTITISNDQFVLGSTTVTNPVAWSLSSSNQKASFLQRENGINLMSYNSEGELLAQRNMEFFVPTDNTVNTYQFDSGRIVLRDNVANFTFLNSKAETAYSVSNSSGSMDGERESQLAADASGNTIVLYNPVISFGSQTGSRAQLVYGDRNTEVFFNSRTEEIQNLRVSDDGSFITILLNGGGGSRIAIFDRFGNEIFDIESDENLVGATLNENASHLTIYSSGRVQVYEIPDGGRVGSASSRSSIIFAGYDPGSQTIIALGGTQNGIEISEPEITAVSISAREIARQEVPFSISTLDANRLDLAKNGAKYEIEGLNRRLFVGVSF
ncbi:hypothetical protein [Rhodohalobacter sp. 614A]|uniref:hypothetical protein n=1 Tax=Rhodohalobacter sp. 614A TaxID=2908649 RepID=UPI001F273247|nr:hypothetical protein [Rhodohalobacter sp. 614A]